MFSQRDLPDGGSLRAGEEINPAQNSSRNYI